MTDSTLTVLVGGRRRGSGDGLLGGGLGGVLGRRYDTSRRQGASPYRLSLQNLDRPRRLESRESLLLRRLL